MTRLRISEIFYSLQGESNSVGLPTVFVRLTGCPLRCGYCDTTYAFKGGEWLELAQVLAQVADYAPRHVTVTGGEPLAQEACLELLGGLCDAGYRVSLETSGALDIGQVDPRVVTVMDLKTPGSGEVEKNRFSNIDHLKQTDQVKFVICDEVDYHWACEQLQAWDLDNRCQVLFSPALGRQDATQLAEWILRDRLHVRFQIQLHKYLWGDVAGK
ncbi:7-carboxy-7-deazaguanine synthase QueE [Sedimenticola thiotaurini]|uniref:7-carboxy-7-deazaguanine synthase n=1 Tax=Sedimenticola thiotaurini TaxID=1543721 RepID=A0A0F7K3H1_9GAMM|nr:7-carboxy-7-deazaguanine synthase QueE [Sedimenticola thiotaurini]AKH21785.1 7-carboxy-7-deazaguanine synthase [Sedimenticola thiotaurini]